VDLDILTARLAGYSGADIVQVCLRASTLAFLDAVKRGIERYIAWSDFETALAETPPSVSVRDLQRFEQFARERGQ
jgi:SpoVK/Ycf46/Vps4 family AAA+-type ATPase